MSIPSSNIGIIDYAVKTLLYTKFSTDMGLSNIDEEINFYPFDIALRETAEERAGTKLNFISFWRKAAGPDWDRRRTPLGRKGMEVAWHKSDHSDLMVMKAVPVDVKYEICFWASKDSFDNLQQVTDTYIYWHDEQPTVNVSFNSYNLSFQLYTDQLEDYSSIETQYQKGQYFIYKANLWIDGWLPKFELDWTVTKIFVNLYDSTNSNNIVLYTETIT